MMVTIVLPSFLDINFRSTKKRVQYIGCMVGGNCIGGQTLERAGSSLLRTFIPASFYFSFNQLPFIL